MINCKKPAAALVLILMVSGCASNQQVLEVVPSGFIQDYSILEKGEDEQAMYQYWQPGVHWGQYHKVIVDPVVMVMDENSKLNNVMQSERERLKELLLRRLRDALRRDFQLVVRPGPNVLRIRTAITEAQASSRTVDVTSALNTAGDAMVSAGEAITGDYQLVSSTTVEGEIIDSETGRLLAAAVDRRPLGKSMFGLLTNWDQFDQNLQYMAQRLQLRLCEKRNLTHCYQ